MCGMSGGSVVGGSHYDVVRIAQAEVGVREATGRNDGKRVEEYLACVGFKKGAAWCSAFVSWVFFKAGYGMPRTAWSPALFPKGRVIEIATSRNAPRNDKKWRDYKRGLVFGIYFSDLKRIAHCGILIRVKGEWCETVEGNTSSEGGREGDGVYRKLRHKRTIAKMADWL